MPAPTARTCSRSSSYGYCRYQSATPSGEAARAFVTSASGCRTPPSRRPKVTAGWQRDGPRRAETHEEPRTQFPRKTQTYRDSPRSRFS